MIKNVVYRILNTVDGKCYIGQALWYEQRISQHIAALKKGKHHNYLLQAAHDQYGIEAFRFVIVEEGIPAQQLDSRENYWIGYFLAQGDGYNLIRLDTREEDAHSMDIQAINVQLTEVKIALYLKGGELSTLIKEVDELRRRERKLVIARRQLRRDAKG